MREWVSRLGDTCHSKLRQVDLTGWGYNATPNTDRGKLWVTLSSTDIKLFKDDQCGSSDCVASSTGNSFSTTAWTDVTLASANSSGLSGTVKVLGGSTLTATSPGTLVLWYADYEDLKAFEKDLSSWLDSDNKWEGKVYFEIALREAKWKVDEWVRTSHRNELERLTDNWPDMSNIADLDQLTDPQRFYALYLIYWNEKNKDSEEDALARLAVYYKGEAADAFKDVSLRLDYDSDDEIDRETRGAGSIRLGRA